VRALVEDGVSVYMLDHGSTDETAAIARRWQGRGVIGVEAFPVAPVGDAARAFEWEAILRRKEALAAELDADWFIHHDADEFREGPWAGESLVDGIRRVDASGCNAIDFHLLNFRPTAADAASGDVRTRMQYYEAAEPWNQVQIKCWKKSRHRVSLASSGGHSAEFPGRRVFPIRFLLRHYPIRSQAHGERKVFAERLPNFVAAERARGWHVQYEGMQPGTSFLHAPADLRRFDADEVRLGLQVHNRECDRAHRAAIASEDVADRLTDEKEAIRVDRDRLHADLVHLRDHLATLDAELERLRAERHEWHRERLEMSERLVLADKALVDIQASRSWRLTAPLRWVFERLARR
jgi:hypothetical protein